jgi:hypothetical protein
VGGRLHGRLRPLARSALSEADAFRVLVRVVGALVVIVAIVLIVRALT